MLLSAENLLTGNVLKWFMQTSEMQQAMKLAGLEWPQAALPEQWIDQYHTPAARDFAGAGCKS